MDSVDSTQELNVFFATANGGRGGTFSDPAGLVEIQADSRFGAGDVIVLLDRSGNVDGNIVLNADRQQVVGGGDDGAITLSLADAVDANGIPNGTQLALSGLGGRPTLLAPPGSAITLQDQNLITGLTISGGTTASPGAVTGISSAGSSNTRIADVDFENMTVGGIVITPSTDTHIDDATFTNVGGNHIHLNAADSTISNVVINSPRLNSMGLLLENATGTTTITSFDFNGVTGANGVSFVNAADTVNVSGLDIASGLNALDITGGTATFTFNDTSIVNPDGIGVQIDGGTASAVFRGDSTVISTENSGALINITNVSGTAHSTGTVTFEAGTLRATGGTGLQFRNADGRYEFSTLVDLDGSDAGIDILEGSDGTFSFGSGTSITNPTGIAFNVEGGTAGIHYSGTIANETDSVIAVTNAVGGDVRFDGASIMDTGNGVALNNANGNVTIHNATLQGAEGLDIDGGTGTFTLVNSTITDPAATVTNPTAARIAINGGGSILQFENSVLTQTANTFSLFNVAGGHTGAVRMNSGSSMTISSGSGLSFNASNGMNDFSGTNTLSGGPAISIANSSGSFMFGGNTTMTNPTGDAITVSGGAPTVSYLGSITNNSGYLVNASNTTGGLITVANTTPGEIVDSGSGIQVLNSQMSGHFGGVGLTGGNIVISGTSGTWELRDINISNSTADAVMVSGVDSLTVANLALANNVGGLLVNNVAAISLEGDSVTKSLIATGSTATSPAIRINSDGSGQTSTVAIRYVEITPGVTDGLVLSASNGATLNAIVQNSIFATGTTRSFNALVSDVGSTLNLHMSNNENADPYDFGTAVGSIFTINGPTQMLSATSAQISSALSATGFDNLTAGGAATVRVTDSVNGLITDQNAATRINLQPITISPP